jgi:DNA replication protein DnaC
MNSDNPLKLVVSAGTMPDSELPTEPIQGPQVSAEWLRVRRERAQAAAEKAARDDLLGWLTDMSGFVDRETGAWAALPCHGERELAGDCSDEFAATCERREHVMCARRQQAQKRAEEWEARETMRRTAKRLGVPERALEAIHDKAPIETPAVIALRSALETPGVALVVLSGGVGCGKSCAAAMACIERGGRFVTAPDLAKASAYDESADEVNDARFLVLDDLGTEYSDQKGYFLSRLDALVNHRYANKLPTVITTNLAAAEFKKYGERIASRILEAGKFVKVGGGDLRKAPR